MILDLEELKRTLQPAFTEQQSSTLAKCLYEYYQPIVHQREMAAIRDTLGRAAAIQERTDERLERITATLDRTEERFDRLAAVDERIELQLDRLAVAGEESNRRIDRLAAAQEESNRRLDRMAVAQEESGRRLDQLAVAQEESGRRLDQLATAQESTRADIEHLAEITKEVVWGIGDLRKQVGGITLSVGQGLEAYAMERIPTLLEQQFGYQTKSAMPEFLGPDGDTSEIDVVYRGRHEGRPIVVLCEVKTNITETEVREFLAIADRVRPSIVADDVRVLFFGYRAGESARRLIAEYGCILAFPRGIVAS
ncbi:MAG: hypothetical protein WD060_14360 [Pirellulales bacterium]